MTKIKHQGIEEKDSDNGKRNLNREKEEVRGDTKRAGS